MYFNVEAFLDDAGIEYKTKGVDVPRGAVNIRCIYCNDYLYHLAIRKRKRYANCWICKAYVSTVQVVKDIAKCTWKEAREIVYGDRHWLYRLDDDKEEAPTRAHKCVLPKGTKKLNEFSSITDRLWKNAIWYTSERISEKTIIENDLHYGYAGEQAYRIVVPMYFGGQLVTYTGRDWTGASSIRYKTCEAIKSVMLPTEILYGIDSFEGRKAMIVEGPFDKLVMGSQALAASTNKLSAKQKNLIAHLDLEELVFVLDPDAEDEAEELAEYFRPVIDKIKVVGLPVGKDPASVGSKQVWRLVNHASWFDF